MKTFWVGTMNRFHVCEDFESPPVLPDNKWTQVSEEVYNKLYDIAYEEACNSPWHCQKFSSKKY